MKRQNTGRKKIPIKKIEETTRRQVTFSKRRMGLFKKASELCVLTGAEMAILVQSPGGHCYAFRHPSVDAVIDRYENKGSSTSVSPKQPSMTELINLEYAELEKELEREKRTYEVIQQEKIGKSSSSVFVPWYEQDVEGMEVEELEQYLAALVELKRKALVRVDDLANIWRMHLCCLRVRARIDDGMDDVTILVNSSSRKADGIESFLFEWIPIYTLASEGIRDTGAIASS
ncbi:agamous-like MADS-box protein AGL62, partial [Tanacetum coccineum]